MVVLGWLVMVVGMFRQPFSLIVRNDAGQINSSPRAITAPVVRLQEGCNHTLTLPVSDPDGDIIRCRWAVGFRVC